MYRVVFLFYLPKILLASSCSRLSWMVLSFFFYTLVCVFQPFSRVSSDGFELLLTEDLHQSRSHYTQGVYVQEGIKGNMYMGEERDYIHGRRKGIYTEEEGKDYLHMYIIYNIDIIYNVSYKSKTKRS